MNLQAFLTLLPYIFSLGISVVVAVYCLRRQQLPGARAYGWLGIAQSVWVAAFILRLTGSSLDEKLFWTNTAWLAIFSIPYIYPVFTAQFIGYNAEQVRLLRITLAIVPIGMACLLFTEPYHHLIYPNPHLVPGTPFTVIDYDLSPLIRAYGAYSVLVIVGTVAALAERYVHPHHLYRSQVLAIIIASLVPTATTILAITGVTETDLTPLTFIFRNLIVLWALFRYRLFDIMPVARDTVIENINDPVVVADLQDRIVDINPAATARIGIPAAQAIGQPLATVFVAWPELVENFADVKQTKTQINVKVDGQQRYFDLSISPLHDRKGRFVGRVFVAREITEHTQLEQRLQRLNDGLEERVRERTEELDRAYDTTLQGWARALEFRDQEMEGHSRRVTELTIRLARALDVPEDRLVHIRRGALLHDIGKMAIPDEILRKEIELTEAEKEIVARHPRIAYELLSPILYLEEALEIPYCHHERWDGSGYPRGLKEREIPLSARIFAVADVWDSLQSSQPYREAWPKDKIIAYMRKQSGRIFDPEVLQVFIRLVEK